MTKETKKGTPPSHSINHVVELDEDKAFWTRIGAGWTHEDGKGLSIVLNYRPEIAGRLVIREIETKQGAKS